MSDATVPRLPTFAGFPLGSWAFALRVWIAVVAALYVAFWLQLEAASSAAVCVARRVFPTPPTPMIVTNRASRIACASAASSDAICSSETAVPASLWRLSS